jgi:hypothetical protein
MPITVKFEVNQPRGRLFEQKPGGGWLNLQTSMRVLEASDQRLAFGVWPRRAVFPVIWTLAYLPAFFADNQPTAALVGVFGVVSGLLMTAGFLWWQEALTLDLVSRTYGYRRGYWPKLTSDQGELSDITSVGLDVLVRSGSEGHDTITWVVSLLFADPAKSIAVVKFAVESLAYQCFADLAKRLGLPAVDRTGARERTVAPAEIDKPLAERAETRHFMPALPEGGRIAVIGDAPERRIVLPPAGVSLNHLVLPIMPLFVPWWTGTLSHWQASAPFIGLGVLFALGSLVALLSHREIAETPESLVISTRLFAIPLAKRRYQKRDIVDVELKPVPGRARLAQELQIRTGGAVTNLRGGRLRQPELAWLAQAMLVLVRAS